MSGYDDDNNNIYLAILLFLEEKEVVGVINDVLKILHVCDLEMVIDEWKLYELDLVFVALILDV